MRRPFHTRRELTPSLVPLADLLTNTVGIVVFILIFTVLATGGVMLPKRLPIEHSTNAKELDFLCFKGRIMPLNDDVLVDQFEAPFGKLKLTTVASLDAWLNNFNSRKLETDDFMITGEGSRDLSDDGDGLSISLDIDMIMKPKDGAGETVKELAAPNSRFRKLLASHKSDNRFFHAWVNADSIEVFLAARAVAAELNYSSGWRPQKLTEGMRISLAGGGSARKPVVQ